MSGWSYPLEIFVKGCLVVGLLFVSYSFGFVGSLFLIGVSVLLFGLSVFGRFRSGSRFRYPAVFIEVLMAGLSIGVVGYVYEVEYISFEFAVYLCALIVFGVSVLGWFMSENKFLYHFVYLQLFDWGEGCRVLGSVPSRVELYLLDRIFEREVDFDVLFSDMEVCVLNTDGDEFWLTFVDDVDVLLRGVESGSIERECELCRERTGELVESDGFVERFRSRDISLSSRDVICVDCRDELLRVLVTKGVVDESDVFVSRI